jgi:hypothetical protein
MKKILTIIPVSVPTFAVFYDEFTDKISFVPIVALALVELSPGAHFFLPLPFSPSPYSNENLPCPEFHLCDCVSYADPGQNYTAPGFDGEGMEGLLGYLLTPDAALARRVFASIISRKVGL